MRKLPALAAFLALLAAGTSSPARAEKACDLTSQIAELKAFQSDTSMDEVAALNAEIRIRRQVLSAAIECDRVDIGARVHALGQMPDKMKTVEAYSKILEGLAKTYEYYDSKKAEIQSLGVWDLKTASREMAAWRKSTYLPTITWADNFLIWANNQQFLEKASERLNQVSGVGFSLKLVNQDEVNKLFEKARENFDIALKENDEAKNALNQKRPLGALVHTQASLKALSDTYDVFFSLQGALQNIVR